MTLLPKKKRILDPDYLKWIRTKPCAICGSTQNVQAHHENRIGHSTLGGKCDDTRCIPMCYICHRIRHDKGKEIYGLRCPEARILRYNADYVRAGHQLKEG